MANYSDQSFLSEHIDATGLGNLKIALITARWNEEVTAKLKEAALQVLKTSGIKKDNILEWDVPGSYELIYAANNMAREKADAIICLGCVIRGETSHFDFICQAVAQGLAQISIQHNKPVAFGVLTTENIEQALERAGGKHGNKGKEAALTILHLILAQNKP